MTPPSSRIGIAKGVVEVPEDIDALNAQIAELFIGKGARTRKAHAIAREISAAMETGIRDALVELDDPIAPRHIVDCMTMSSVDVGRMFKRALLDELWQAKQRK
jgi:hypothetical protein